MEIALYNSEFKKNQLDNYIREVQQYNMHLAIIIPGVYLWLEIPERPKKTFAYTYWAYWTGLEFLT